MGEGRLFEKSEIETMSSNKNNDILKASGLLIISCDTDYTFAMVQSFP